MLSLIARQWMCWLHGKGIVSLIITCKSADAMFTSFNGSPLVPFSSGHKPKCLFLCKAKSFSLHSINVTGLIAYVSVTLA